MQQKKKRANKLINWNARPLSLPFVYPYCSTDTVSIAHLETNITTATATTPQQHFLCGALFFHLSINYHLSHYRNQSVSRICLTKALVFLMLPCSLSFSI